MGMLLTYREGYYPNDERGDNDERAAVEHVGEHKPRRKRTRKAKAQEPTPAPVVEDTQEPTEVPAVEDNPEGNTPDE